MPLNWSVSWMQCLESIIVLLELHYHLGFQQMFFECQITLKINIKYENQIKINFNMEYIDLRSDTVT